RASGVSLRFSCLMTAPTTSAPTATSGKTAWPVVPDTELLALTWGVAVYSGFDRKVRTPAVAAVTITSKIGIQARRLNTRQYSRNSIPFLLLQVRLNDFGSDSKKRSQGGEVI